MLGLGSGVLIENFEKLYVSDGGFNNVAISQHLLNSGFTSSASAYKYMRLLGITITLIPNNVAGELSINVQWTGNPYSESLMQQDDSTRRVPTYTTRYRSIYIKIPNLTVQKDTKILNLGQFIPIDDLTIGVSPVTDLKIPGTIGVVCPSQVSYRINIKVKFRKVDTTKNTIQGIIKSIKAQGLYGELLNQILLTSDYEGTASIKKEEDEKE